MKSENAQFVPKVHPATRAMEPDDPMDLHGFEIPGDTELMLRMLVEEYARLGWGLEALMSLFRDPFYHAAHGLWLCYGEDELRSRVAKVLAQCGVIRVKAVARPAAEQIVQIDLSRK